MTQQQAREKAARVWCDPVNETKAMDVELAEVFSSVLSSEVNPLEHLLSWAWSIIASAAGGNWTKETKEWRETAQSWRDSYHEVLAKSGNAKLIKIEPKLSQTKDMNRPKIDIARIIKETEGKRPVTNDPRKTEKTRVKLSKKEQAQQFKLTKEWEKRILKDI